MNQHRGYQRWHSHPSWRSHCWPNVSRFIFSILCNSRICHSDLTQAKKWVIAINTPLIKIFIYWDIWLPTQTCWCVFTRLCQYHLELERVRRPSYFYLGHFSSSRHTSHHHDWSIASVSFWHINMTNLPQVINYEHGKIFTPTLSQLDILSLLPFPLFYFFLHFPSLMRAFKNFTGLW
jgi:hypothetical protein